MKNKNALEVIIVEILIIIAVSLSFVPTLYYVSIASDTTTFPLIHNNDPDYNFYLSLMRQGLEGRWLVVSRFTPEAFPPQLVQTFFVLLGHLSRLTSINLPMMYTLVRLVLGVGVGLVAYFLLVLFDKRRVVRLVGLIFVLFSSSFWLIKNGQIVQYMSFWTAIDARERTTYLPHHLFGNLTVVISIIFLTLFFKSKKKKFYLFALISSLIGTFVNPKILINFFFTLSGFLILGLFLNLKQIRRFIQNFIFPLLLFLFINGMLLVYFFIMSQTTFPWNSYTLLAKNFLYPTTLLEYILSLGPVFVFSLLGLREVFKRKDFLSLVFFSWLLAPFVGIFIIGKILGLGNVLFFHTSHYVPVGILGAMGLVNLVESTVKSKSKRNIILISLVFLLLIYFSVSWYGSIKKEISRWTPNIFNIFLPKDFFLAFNFLNSQTQKESVVLAEGFLGNIIPAYTHNRTVAGHPVNTYDYQQKRLDMANFFAQNDPTNARKTIEKYNVKYIFFTYDTGTPQETFIKAINLQKIYQNPTVTIYKTK